MMKTYFNFYKRITVSDRERPVIVVVCHAAGKRKLRSSFLTESVCLCAAVI